jgi:hypothetical protein
MVGHSRRSAGPSASNHSHDHEWECYGGEDSFLVEDGAAFVYEDCSYAEVTGSATCDRLDETFYEYGYECEATRRHRYDIVGISRVSVDGESSESLAETREGVEDVLGDRMLPVAEIESAAAERLCEADSSRPKSPQRGGPEILDWESGLGSWDEGPHTITVEAGGATWQLVFERTSVEVDQ